MNDQYNPALKIDVCKVKKEKHDKMKQNNTTKENNVSKKKSKKTKKRKSNDLDFSCDSKKQKSILKPHNSSNKLKNNNSPMKACVDEKLPDSPAEVLQNINGRDSPLTGLDDLNGNLSNILLVEPSTSNEVINLNKPKIISDISYSSITINTANLQDSKQMEDDFLIDNESTTEAIENNLSRIQNKKDYEAGISYEKEQRVDKGISINNVHQHLRGNNKKNKKKKEKLSKIMKGSSQESQLREAFKQIDSYKSLIIEKDKEIENLRNLNMQLQRDILAKMDEYGIFRHFLLTEKKCDPVTTQMELTHVGEYVAQKISDLNRKRRKRNPKETNCNEDNEAKENVNDEDENNFGSESSENSDSSDDESSESTDKPED